MTDLLQAIGFRFGDLIVIASIIGALIKSDRDNQKREAFRDMRVQNVIDDVTDLKSDMKEVRSALQTISTQKVQIDFLIKAYDELRHGQGFVRDAKAN